MVNAGLAYPAFTKSFKDIFEGLDVIRDPSEVENLDLVVFSGGEDIDPDIYGQKNRFSSFNPRRDRWEIPILERALELEKKILGVCRGHQLINAYLGGVLVQDISYELGIIHGGWHEITWSGLPSNIFPHFEHGVNSLHHQGVVIPGRGLSPTTFFGGVIESTEGDNILTVQWHPEFMFPDDASISFFNWILNTWLGENNA